MEELIMWLDFPVFASVAICCWLGASALFFTSGKKLMNEIAAGLSLAGTVVLLVFVTILWMHIERPPMRTLGETRLWYAIFLSGIGLVSYFRWKYKWLINYSLGLSILFLIINLQHPETYDKTLMPALQSPWFIPHVIVYIFAYAMLGASSVVALRNLFFVPSEKTIKGPIQMADNLVYLGFSFLTFGLLFGALWAKEAWGNYWTWDPKETWAFITWMFYLVYIHYRFRHPSEHKRAMGVLAVAFIVLLICWFGVNYLPSAQNSVHVYSE
jgi:ABC-type transport system involved in cytochrome c biogenesis permease subunit